MKTVALCLPATLAAALLLCSCAPLPRQVAFNEAAFVPYRSSGSGTVKGQAYTVLRDNTKPVGENSDIGLMPDNPYTEEIVNQIFTWGKKLTPPDPRFAKYVRFVTTDSDGDFVFNHVPPGKYVVYMDLPFHYTDEETQDDGSEETYRVDDDQWIWNQITVKNGQTVKVDNWSQGK